ACSGIVLNDWLTCSCNLRISPFDQSNQSTQPGDGGQQNFEVSYMEVKSGATYTGTTYSGTAVQVHNGGSFIVDKGATVDLQRTSAVGANEDGFNALIYTSGSVEFKEGSKVTLNKNKLQETNFSPIYIDTGANLTVDKDAVVNIDGATGNTPIKIVGNGTVNLNEGSSMTINQTGDTFGTNGVINIAGSGGFYVASGSTLAINVTGTDAASINVIKTTGSSQLSFAQDATAKLTINGGTGIAYVLNIGNNSKINIYMPKSILFSIEGNTNSASSIFDVTGSGALTGQYVKIIPDNGKNPFGPYKSVSYALSGKGSTSTKATVQGLTPDAETSGEDLADDFATDTSLEFVTAADNFVTVDPVTNETTTLTGKTGADGYVTITGLKGLPAGTLMADPYDSTKYLVQADDNGNWSYKLPAGVTLTANTSFKVVSSDAFIVKTATVVVNDAETPKQASSAADSSKTTSTAADGTSSQEAATNSFASAAASYASEAETIAKSQASNATIQSLASDAQKQASLASDAEAVASKNSTAAAAAAKSAANAASEASSAAAAVASDDALASSAAAAYDSYAAEASAASAVNDSAGLATASSAASAAAAQMNGALSDAQTAAKVAASDAIVASSAAVAAAAAQSEAVKSAAAASAASKQALDDLNKIKDALNSDASGASSSASQADSASTHNA
ncbi:hypothetical protein U1R89_00785, partial [Lacticaseibacillus casei]|nr:hypothetical protein [Lacticaseibacillus casei]